MDYVINSIFIIMFLIMGIAVIAGPIIWSIYSKKKGITRLIQIIACIFFIVGAIGFFGSALSSLGGLNWLPKSFEWPVGLADGIIETSNGLYIVPHTPSGRVQIYDSNWKFVRGWHVEAFGGTFELVLLNDNRFEVITARKQMHYIYDIEGNLISSSSYRPSNYTEFPKEGIAFWVPTKPWLLVFSHPFASWATFMVGMIALGIIDKKKRRKKKRSEESNQNSGL